uniref:Histone acetyltransferase n=1 Tax=Psilocybe cubensis TaxID=181762 RepID=A0A8H7Y3Q1_PSICU
MRGLAFPPNTPADREPSYEYGTPISNVDDIPIDPALGGAPIDPALMPDEQHTSAVPEMPPAMTEATNQLAPHEPPLSDDYQIRQYSQGPQGDPFAPQIPTPFFPALEQTQQPTPPPKPKRKRKVFKEEECSFCQGSDAKNKRGEGEQMLTCHECGRSGWHMDCMVPPLENPPEGEWHCPQCPPVIAIEQPQLIPPQEEGEQPTIPSAREPSVASTSRSALEPQPTPTKPKRIRKPSTRKKTKTAKAAASEASDEDEDEAQVPESATPTAYRGRGRPPKGTVRAKARAPTASSEEEIEVPSARPHRRKRPRESSPPPAMSTSSRVVRLRIPPQRGKGKGREEEEPERGLFDDILGVEERDTSKTTPTNVDKAYFERSRIAAEVKTAPPPPPTASSSRTGLDGETSTPSHGRPLRSSTLQRHTTPKLLDFANSPGPSTPGAHTPLPKLEPGVLRIRSIRFGPYDIKTWYDAPFPEEYASIPDGRLWICEFCLKYMKGQSMAIRHQIYCQNLCLLSKMFLDHKSLFYDVEPFLFYVITQMDDLGGHFVGYFSKEKRCPKDYNLSCIMTLPVRQRQGWGNLLMDFSYLLSKVEQRLGSPEKPLSSLGALGYKNYWTLAINRFLEKAPDNIRLEDISSATSMTIEDVCNTLVQLNMIYIREATPPPIRPSPGQSIKFPKGRKNGLPRKQLQRLQSHSATPNGHSGSAQDKDRDGGGAGAGDGSGKGAFVPPKHYEIRWDREKVDAYLRKWEAKGYLALKPEKLQWTPYIVARTEAAVVGEQIPAVSAGVEDGATKEQQQQQQSVVVPPPPMVHEPETPATPVSVPAAPPPDPDPDPVVEINGATTSATDDSRQPSRSPAVEPDGQVEDQSMNVDDEVDDDAVETRARTRSGNRSPVKGQERPPPRMTRAVSLPSSPPAQTPSRSLRTRSSHLNIPSPAKSTVGASTSTRATRLKGGGGGGHAKKAAAANGSSKEEEMKMPMQEEQPVQQTPTRTLRSGRGEVQSENKRPLVVTTPRGAVGRKRRRIESSPEVEESPVPEEVVVVKEPLNGAEGEETSMVVDLAAPPLKVNGAAAVEEIQPPPLITPPSTATPVDGGTVEEERVVKSEEGLTPMTSVFMGSMEYKGYHGAVHAESDLRSTLGAELMDLDDCHDEDADGEYEEDDGEYVAVN